MNQNNLRKQVKLLKALQGISYKEISEYLDINTNSLYNWLREQYDFSEQRYKDLCDIVCNLKE